jgi:hypothetical protein
MSKTEVSQEIHKRFQYRKYMSKTEYLTGYQNTTMYPAWNPVHHFRKHFQKQELGLEICFPNSEMNIKKFSGRNTEHLKGKVTDVSSEKRQI